MFVFNPYPFRGGVIKLLYPFAIIPFISKKGIREIKRDYAIILSLILIVLFDFFVALRGGDSKFINSFINIIEMVFVPIGIGLYYNSSFPRRDILKDLVLLCSIAASITVFLAMNPEIAYAVRLVFNSQTEHMEEATRRMYGISQFLLFTYSVLMGYVAGYCLFFKGIWKILSLLIILGVVFNARIGFVPFVIVFLLKAFSLKNLKQNLLMVLLLLIIVPLALNWLSASFPDTFDWLAEGFEESKGLTKGEKSGTFAELGDMLVFPSTLGEWIWGSGKNIFRAQSHNTDIGYLLQLNYGGIIYILLLFYTFFCIIKKVSKTVNDKKMVLAIVLTLLIVNYKGDILSSNEFTRFILLIATCYSLRGISNRTFSCKEFGNNGR